MNFLPMQDDIEFANAQGSFGLTSYYEDQLTIIFDADGETVWVAEEYIGSRRFFLSPDGQTLVLVGDAHTGTHMTTGAYLDQGENPVVVRVYQNGDILRDIHYGDLYSQPVSKLVKKYDLPEKGGGWINLSDIVLNLDGFEKAIDWKKQDITFHLLGQGGVFSKNKKHRLLISPLQNLI